MCDGITKWDGITELRTYVVLYLIRYLYFYPGLSPVHGPITVTNSPGYEFLQERDHQHQRVAARHLGEDGDRGRGWQQREPGSTAARLQLRGPYSST